MDGDLEDSDQLVQSVMRYIDRYDYTPVVTQYGVLYGRGTIRLGAAVYSEPASVCIYCEVQVNCNDDKAEPQYESCKLSFNGVYDFRMGGEVDIANCSSSFDTFALKNEVLKSLPVDDRARIGKRVVLGYQVMTYDTVFEIYCDSYKLEKDKGDFA